MSVTEHLAQLTPEQMILLLKIAGAACIVLALFLVFRFISKNNELSAKEAKKLLKQLDHKANPWQPISTAGPEEEPKEPPKKTKSQLLAFTMSPDAHTMLDQLDVKPDELEGWHITNIMPR